MAIVHSNVIYVRRFSLLLACERLHAQGLKVLLTTQLAGTPSNTPPFMAHCAWLSCVGCMQAGNVWGRASAVLPGSSALARPRPVIAGCAGSAARATCGRWPLRVGYPCTLPFGL